MLRKLILLGVFVGVSASVPVIIEQRAAVRAQDPAAPAASETPRAALAVEQSLSGRKMRIGADASGHFSAQFSVNGKPVAGVVDTGATLVALNESTARRLGIRLAPADFTREARTANGVVRAAPVVLERIVIGRVEVQQVGAIVLSDKALGETLIGMSFLGKLKRYSVAEGALVLEQ